LGRAFGADNSVWFQISALLIVPDRAEGIRVVNPPRHPEGTGTVVQIVDGVYCSDQFALIYVLPRIEAILQCEG